MRQGRGRSFFTDHEYFNLHYSFIAYHSIQSAVTTSSPVQFFDQQLEHIKEELFEADDKFSCYHNRNIPSVESLLGKGRGEGRIRMVRGKGHLEWYGHMCQSPLVPI